MHILKQVGIDPSFGKWCRIQRPKSATDITFDFKPGLNLIIGHNGSGKTTLVKAIRDYFFAKKSVAGVNIITEQSHDKENMYFFLSEDNNPSVNLNSLSQFDANFAKKIALWSIRKELSSGMNTNALLKDAEILSKTASAVFFDEPELGLDANSIIEFRKQVKKISAHTQVIIVTHHPALILMKGANIIEMNKGRAYLDDVKGLISQLDTVG